MKDLLSMLSLLALGGALRDHSDPDCRMQMGRGDARKSSGGRPKQRIRNARYRAWKRAFGGIACPTTWIDFRVPRSDFRLP